MARAARVREDLPDRPPVRRLLLGPERRLRVGRRLMLYVQDAAGLIARIRRQDEGDRRPVIVRPTNLEDVFLSLTGTRLETNP